MFSTKTKRKFALTSDELMFYSFTMSNGVQSITIENRHKKTHSKTTNKMKKKYITNCLNRIIKSTNYIF